MLNMLLLRREMFYYLKQIISKVKNVISKHDAEKNTTTTNHAAAISNKH